jgi:hypothetical protein
MYSLTTPRKYILLGTVEKTAFSVIFKQNIVGNRQFLALFLCISASVGAYLPILTPSTTTSCPGAPPANSWYTKQFLSHLHGL